MMTWLKYSARIVISSTMFMNTLPTLKLSAESLAGHDYAHTTGKDFSFDPPYGDFAGITYSPVTQTWFVTDNQLDKVFEIQPNGTLLRIIDVSGLKRTGVPTTDVEGVSWMHGQTFAFVLHDGKELAIADIVPTTTSISRSDATIYDISSGPGKPKGIVYVGSEDAFYWVTKDTPKAIVKVQLNRVTHNLDTVWTKTIDNLPVTDLADVTAFHRISPFLIFISESSQSIMEVDVTGPTAVVKSTFSLASWPIPKAGACTFGPDGKMYVVGKHAKNVPNDDFSVFTPSSPITNLAPVPQIALVIN